MITKYSIQKNKMLGKYVVWKEDKTQHGYGCKGVFQGSKKDCEKYLEQLKNN